MIAPKQGTREKREENEGKTTRSLINTILFCLFGFFRFYLLHGVRASARDHRLASYLVSRLPFVGAGAAAAVAVAADFIRLVCEIIADE